MIERPRERRHAVFVANRCQRFDGRGPQQLLVEQRDHQRRDARIVGLAQGLDCGKREEEIVGGRDLRERIDRFGGAETSQCLDGVEADVFVRIVQGIDEHRRRFVRVQLAEREGGVHAQIGFLVRQHARRAARRRCGPKRSGRARRYSGH